MGEVGVLFRGLPVLGAGVGRLFLEEEVARDVSVGGESPGVGGRGLCLLSPLGDLLGSPGTCCAVEDGLVGGIGRGLFLPLSLLAAAACDKARSTWHVLSVFLSLFLKADAGEDCEQGGST